MNLIFTHNLKGIFGNIEDYAEEKENAAREDLERAWKAFLRDSASSLCISETDRWNAKSVVVFWDSQEDFRKRFPSVNTQERGRTDAFGRVTVSRARKWLFSMMEEEKD